MQVRHKTFIVTGGASGLGAACVKALADKQANVVIADLNQEHGLALAKKCGDHVQFNSTNVADEDSVQACVDYTLDHFKDLHGAINCAGIAIVEKVVGKESIAHDLGHFQKVIQVNLVGTFNVMRLVSAAITKLKRDDNTGDSGVIVNTASIAAFDGQIGQAAYTASKSGIVGMTLPCARELARHKIRVMTIAPGIFDTPMLAKLPEPARKALAGLVPCPSRLGDPKEFAALAIHIIENEMLNGEVIRLDGSLRMTAK